jgi:hypothetical protein
VKKEGEGTKSITAIIAVALVAGAAIYFLGEKHLQTAQWGSEPDTDSVAAAAGARVLPTDPKLKVEPK